MRELNGERSNSFLAKNQNTFFSGKATQYKAADEL